MLGLLHKSLKDQNVALKNPSFGGTAQGVPYFGVLIIRILLFQHSLSSYYLGYYIGVPYCGVLIIRIMCQRSEC